MQLRSIQNSFFLVLLVLVTLAFLGLIQDFFQPVFWAAVLAVLFYPVQRWWLRRLEGRSSIAALLTVLTILVIVILPLFGIGLAVSREAIHLYERFVSGEIDPTPWIDRAEALLPIASEQLDRINIDLDQVQERLTGAAAAASGFLASQALAFGQNALTFAVLFFLMLYFLFFFIRDGERLLETAIRALPLGDLRERRLFAKFAEVSRATIKGTLVVGAVQGTLGGLLFWMLGIGAPVLWGVIMTLLSLLPAIGPALVWLPAAIILILTDQVVKGLILIVAGTVVIGLADNLLRPMLVGRETQMPDFLILLATLGGLAVFGITGFVIGPVIAALFLTIWGMFIEEYGAMDDPQPVIDAAENPERAPVPAFAEASPLENG